MANSMSTCKLQDAIMDSGITMTALAKKIGVSRETLYNKVNGNTEFTASEINNLCNAIHIDAMTRDSIFFGN